MSKILVRIWLLLALAGIRSFAQVQTITVGSPWSDFPTLTSAVASLPVPLTNDVNIIVEMGPEGWSESGFDVDGNALGASGFTLTVEGLGREFNSTSDEATYYVGDEIEYRANSDNIERTIIHFGAEARQVIDGSGADVSKDFLLRDHLGSTITTFEEAQITSGPLIEYNAYGRKEHIAGSAVPLTKTYTGKEYDILDPADLASPGLYHFGARSYDPDIAIWISPDPMRQSNSPYAFSSNPVSSTDPDGMVIETPWDAANLGMGLVSFTANAASGNIVGAAVDVVGIAYDGAATFFPGLPGGAGTGIKALRSGKVVDKGAIVIGEGMDAVKNAARKLRDQGIDAKWYQAWKKNFPENRLMTPDELKAALQRNKRWIMSKVKEGHKVFDIGIDLDKVNRSPFYELEKKILNLFNYPTIPMKR